MVSGIAFVRREVDGAIDVDGKIRVDLDDASVPALVPVVAAPRLVRHVFDRKALVVGQRNPLACLPAAFIDGPFEHVRKASRLDDEGGTKPIETLDERAASGKQAIELVERCLEVRLGMGRSDCVVERG